MVEKISLEDMTVETRSSTLRDYLSTVFRYKYIAIVFFLVSVAGVFILIIMQQDLYKSESRLLVTPGWEDMNVDPTAATGDMPRNVNQPLTLLLNSTLEIIKSEDLIEKVVEKIGCDSFFSPYMNHKNNESNSQIINNSFIAKLKFKINEIKNNLLNSNEKTRSYSYEQKKRIAVKALLAFTEAVVLRNKTIISISFKAPDPKLAQSVVEELTNLYIEEHKRVYRKAGSLQFLEKREKELRNNLIDIEKEIGEIKKENKYTNPDRRLEQLEESISETEQEIILSEAAVTASNAKLEELNKNVSELPVERIEETTSTNYSTIDYLKQRIMELRAEKAMTVSKYTDNSEPVKTIDKQIHEIEILLNTESPEERTVTTRVPDESYQEMIGQKIIEKTNLKYEQEKTKVLQSRIKTLSKEFDKIINDRVIFSQKERELQNIKKEYDDVLRALNQAREEDALDRNSFSNIKMIQSATYSMEPEESKKMIILLAGIIGAFMGSVALTFILAYFDNSLKKPEDIEEKLNIDTLVTIPKYRVNRLPIKRRVKNVNEIIKSK